MKETLFELVQKGCQNTKCENCFFGGRDGMSDCSLPNSHKTQYVTGSIADHNDRLIKEQYSIMLKQIIEGESNAVC